MLRSPITLFHARQRRTGKFSHFDLCQIYGHAPSALWVQSQTLLAGLVEAAREAGCVPDEGPPLAGAPVAPCADSFTMLAIDLPFCTLRAIRTCAESDHSMIMSCRCAVIN